MNSLSKFPIAVLIMVLLNWFLPHQAAGASTVQNFDIAGTPYTMEHYDTYGVGDMWTIESGGPTGNFLRLATPTSSTHNTIGFDLTEPGFGSTPPPSGSYLRIIAEFDFRIDGISDGIGLVLLDTATYGPSGPSPDREELEEPSFPDAFGVGLDVIEGDRNHVLLHWNDAQVAEFPIDPNILNLRDGEWHHARVTVDFTSQGARVNVNFDNSFTPVWAYFIPGMTAFESRVGFGARAGLFGAYHDLDNINVQYTTFTPSAVIGSIYGRIVDAATSAPLSGTDEPFAHAYLHRCDSVGCGYVNDQFADGDGQFTFTTDSSGLPLEVGTYRVLESANGYDQGQTEPFPVGEGGVYNVGNVPLEVHVPLAINVTVNPKGVVVLKTGVVTISGTATCTQNAFIYLYGDLKQEVGRFTAIGRFETIFFPCDEGVTPWTATIENGTGFGGGYADLINAYTWGLSGCCESAFSEITGRVRLKGISGK